RIYARTHRLLEDQTDVSSGAQAPSPRNWRRQSGEAATAGARRAPVRDVDVSVGGDLRRWTSRPTLGRYESSASRWRGGVLPPRPHAGPKAPVRNRARNRSTASNPVTSSPYRCPFGPPWTVTRPAALSCTR